MTNDQKTGIEVKGVERAETPMEDIHVHCLQKQRTQTVLGTVRLKKHDLTVNLYTYKYSATSNILICCVQAIIIINESMNLCFSIIALCL